MMDGLNLWWSSFHNVCKSNHYAVHLKHMSTALFLNYISLKFEEKTYLLILKMLNISKYIIVMGRHTIW